MKNDYFLVKSMIFQNRVCDPSIILSDDCGDSLNATLKFSDGSFQYVAFENRSEVNTIILQPVRTTFVKMTITSVYSTVDNGAQILKFFGYINTGTARKFDDCSFVLLEITFDLGVLKIVLTLHLKAKIPYF